MYLGLSRIANYFYFFYSPNVETKIAVYSFRFIFLSTHRINSITNKYKELKI